VWNNEGQALAQAVDLHLLVLLDLAAKFWQVWGAWLSFGLGDGKDTRAPQGRKAWARKAQEFRAAGSARYLAARLLAHIDGWKRFCAEIHLEPQVLLQDMPGWQTVARTEREARELAFTPQEAAEFLRWERAAAEGDDEVATGPAPVETAEALAKAWHEMIDELVQAS
jgi:hypothetical protein